MHSSDPLNVDSILSTLGTKAIGRRIDLFEEVASTNLEAIALAQSGVEHGTVVIADRQTAGRGRLARNWFSPGGANVYCSTILRSQPLNERLPEWFSWLPLTTAVAAAEAIESVTSARVFLKWPNDLLMSDRKVGGILCENTSTSPSGPFQIIGIGINVNLKLDEFPTDLRESATSLQHETGIAVDRNRLIAQFLQEFEQCVDELALHGPHKLAIAYQQRCATIGKRVCAILAGGSELTGYAESVDHDGSLRLTIQSGTNPHKTVNLRAADIVHLKS